MYYAIPVFATIVFHVVPPSVDLSILYPVIAEPPLFVGAVQLRLICDGETAVAERLVGGCGVVAVMVDGADVVLDGVFVAFTLFAAAGYVWVVIVADTVSL